MIEPIEIKWNQYKSELNQIYDRGMEYCFVSENNVQACPFVRCKDFLQDTILSKHTNKPVSIYGFAYDPKKDAPIPTEKTRLAVVNKSDKKFSDKIPAILDLLNQIEIKLHLIKTIAIPAKTLPKGYSCAFILEGSSRWMLSPPMLSLYALLIRVGGTHKVGDEYNKTFKKLIGNKVNSYQRDDATLLKSAQKGIDRIIKYGYAKLFFKEPSKNYPDVNVSYMHNYFGICGYSSETTKQFIKYWHRDPDKPKSEVPKKKLVRKKSIF